MRLGPLPDGAEREQGEGVGTAVLVHGLWLHGIVFWPLRRWLAGAGVATCTFSYPSVRRTLAENAGSLSVFLHAIPSPIIHLVGHSLGGLVILSALASRPDPRVRRVVLLGSPCAGSYCGDVLLRHRASAAIVGRSLRDWLQQPRPRLPEGVEVGTLAGNRSLGLGRLIPGLPRPNDGVVTVAETSLAGARDRVVLPVSHSQMLVSKACAAQIASFLDHGRFVHA